MWASRKALSFHNVVFIRVRLATKAILPVASAPLASFPPESAVSFAEEERALPLVDASAAVV
jgi:hypothetical protein